MKVEQRAEVEQRLSRQFFNDLEYLLNLLNILAIFTKLRGVARGRGSDATRSACPFL